MTRLNRLWACLTLVWLALLGTTWAAPSPERPRLVVLLVFDQFRSDYLNRFADRFDSEGGFRYLVEHGAVHTACHYDHLPTHTAVGHSALVTGALPRDHGIVGNTWYQVDSGQRVTSVADPASPMVGAGRSEQGASPHRLLSDTLGDELKLATRGRSRVISLSIKDRAAVLMGGFAADLAAWFDEKTGRWVSSRFYLPDDRLPGWVEVFNRSGWVDEQFGWLWEPLLPAESYTASRRFVQSGTAGERVRLGESFPHRVDGGLEKPGPGYYEAFAFTPPAMTMTFDLARAAVEAEGLGQDRDPDLLALSLSSHDKTGHAYGPYSPEIEDLYLRTDLELGEFLEFLDERVGLDKTLVILSSDHGVAPLTELAAELRLPARRIDRKNFEAQVEKALGSLFGPGDYVETFVEPHLYLRHAGIPAGQLERAREVAARAALEFPGVHSARTPEADPQNHCTGRTGDLLIVLRPFHTFSFDPGTGTTHGQPWTYDTHVPLVLAGAGVPSGQYHEQCTPRDLAPTVCDMLGVTPPAASTGRVLEWRRERSR